MKWAMMLCDLLHLRIFTAAASRSGATRFATRTTDSQFITDVTQDAISDMIPIRGLAALAMSIYSYLSRACMTIKRRVPIAQCTTSSTCLVPSSLPELYLLNRFLQSQLRVRLCLLCLSLFLFVGSSLAINANAAAAELAASPIAAVPTNGSNAIVICNHPNSYTLDVGTRKVVYARGAYCSVGAKLNGVKAGQTFAVSGLQVAAASSFGVKFVSVESYPFASFITYDNDSKTAYYVALVDNPTVAHVFDFDNDAQYVFSAYVFTETDLSAIRGYVNSVNELVKIVVQQQVAINLNISAQADILAKKLDAVSVWISASIDYSKADHAKILDELKKINQHNQQQQQQQQQLKSDAAAADHAFKNDSFFGAADHAASDLSSVFSKLFNSSSDRPVVSGSFNGVDLNFDFSKIPQPPSWLVLLEAIPCVFISWRCLAQLLRTIPELVVAWRDQNMHLSMVFDFIGG